MELWIDTRLVNPTNQREHWSRRSKRAARQRELVAMTFLQALGRREIEAAPERPKRIHFLAFVGRGFDEDNLQAALKAIRDGLVDARLIQGDGPGDGHVFTYAQHTSTPVAKQGVRVVVTLA